MHSKSNIILDRWTFLNKFHAHFAEGRLCLEMSKRLRKINLNTFPYMNSTNIT